MFLQIFITLVTIGMGIFSSFPRKKLNVMSAAIII